MKLLVRITDAKNFQRINVQVVRIFSSHTPCRFSLHRVGELRSLLEEIQIKVARNITGEGIKYFKKPNKLGLETLSVGRKEHQLILFYKIVYKLAHNSPNDLL